MCGDPLRSDGVKSSLKVQSGWKMVDLLLWVGRASPPRSVYTSTIIILILL